MTPHIPSWHWGLRPALDAPPRVTVRARPEYEIEIDFGSIPEVFADLDGIAGEPPAELAWRHFHKAECWDPTFPFYARVQDERRQKNETHGHHVATALLEACGLYPRDTSKWRALSLNAVLHPMFGPGLTAATNGVDVILVSAPSFDADWMLVHRTNIIGPVTGTPHAVADWDYLGNRPARCFAGSGPKGRKTPSAHAVARQQAEALL